MNVGELGPVHPCCGAYPEHGHRCRAADHGAAPAETTTPPRYAFTRDELATALTRLDVRVLTDGPCAGMINADAMAGAILAALHETGTEWGDGAMKMPFEKLMEHVATLSEKDEALTLGELAERWGEPVKRIADAIDAVRVMGGDRTYVTIDVPAAAPPRV